MRFGMRLRRYTSILDMVWQTAQNMAEQGSRVAAHTKPSPSCAGATAVSASEHGLPCHYRCSSIIAPCPNVVQPRHTLVAICNANTVVSVWCNIICHHLGLSLDTLTLQSLASSKQTLHHPLPV